MNKFIGIGFISKKGVNLTFATGTGNAIAKFSLSIPRTFNKGDKKEYDFISCVAFGKTAEFLANNESKIKKLLVEGHIQTGSYDAKDGTKRYTTDVIIEKSDVVEWNNEGQEQQNFNRQNDFIEERDGGDIPF